jgi:cysteine-rich repeat protein
MKGVLAAVAVAALALGGCEWIAGTNELGTECPAGRLARPDGKCVSPEPSCSSGEVVVAGQCMPSACADGGTCSAAPDCGNGTTESGEACDDGNRSDGDYCSADCSSITGKCGDASVQVGEACDDGNDVDGDYCSSDCKTFTGKCADGVKQSNEQCDDGNTDGGDYCSADCSLETGFCGDCIVQDNEQCDDGNSDDDDYCSADCMAITGRCGDGIVQKNEVCDNGPGGGVGCVACRDDAPGPTVSVGTNLICGVQSSGSAKCVWVGEPLGSAAAATLVPPSGSYRSVTAGAQYACGVLQNGTLLCWGPDTAQLPMNPYTFPEPVPQPPLGKFLRVSLASYGCAIRTDGTLACFASPPLSQQPPVDPPSGELIDVAGSCGLRPDRSLVCWGNVSQGYPLPGEENSGGVCPFHQFSGDCGVRPNGTIDCLGAVDPKSVPPPGTYREVGSGVGYHCALGTGGEVACWGMNALTPPAGPFSRISVGPYIACAVREADGGVACWGDAPYPFTVPTSPF